MKRTQPQFDPDDKIDRDFVWHCIKAAGVLLLSFLILLFMGWAQANGEQIDNFFR